jgi:hypothetical protein
MKKPKRSGMRMVMDGRSRWINVRYFWLPVCLLASFVFGFIGCVSAVHEQKTAPVVVESATTPKGTDDKPAQPSTKQGASQTTVFRVQD